ncbi:MAG TPA: hypothetical protein VL086_09170 [Candidatus Nitrosotalea sp.]|nr:hypothetical protein [Candidatus Nitrosotalea sp.]
MRSRLSIVCSSPEGQARLDRIAAELLERMPPDMAARLARRCLVFALDGTQHAAFVQGMGGPQDAVTQLAIERTRQGEAAARAAEPVAVIVLQLVARWRQSLEHTLAHELGHVDLGHTEASAVAAALMTDEELTERERAADAFAARYASW